MSDGRWGRWAAVAIVALLAAVFALLNGDERISLDLGFTVVYQLPLAVLVFLCFVLGMIAMFLFGLRHDLRMRELLRQRQPEWREPEPRPAPPHPSWSPEPPPSDTTPL